MAGYIRAARPDLTFILNGPFPGMKTPRYTSGGDLNYLEVNTPPEHYVSFEVQLRLGALSPGFQTAAGLIAEPPTMTRIKPSACKDSLKANPPAGEWRLLIIRNDTASRLDLTKFDGSKTQVDAYAWRRYALPAGTSVKTSDSRCLAAGEAGDPVLAIIEEL
jgi:hypothetical protein